MAVVDEIVVDAAEVVDGVMVKTRIVTAATTAMIETRSPPKQARGTTMISPRRTMIPIPISEQESTTATIATTTTASRDHAAVADEGVDGDVVATIEMIAMKIADADQKITPTTISKMSSIPAAITSTIAAHPEINVDADAMTDVVKVETKAAAREGLDEVDHAAVASDSQVRRSITDKCRHGTTRSQA